MEKVYDQREEQYAQQRKLAVSHKDESEGCCCQRCGLNYTVDLIVDDELWEAIKPVNKAIGAGMLCGSCIMDSIETSHSFTCFNLKLNNPPKYGS